MPYFRTLARQLGEARMRAGLAKLHYGNEDISGGLDAFWLRGGMRISAAQQLAFVEALARDTLDVSKHAQAVVRDISTQKDDARHHAKTGSGPLEDRETGWLVWQVGWIAQPDGTIIPYAGWMESPAASLDAAREARTQRLRTTLEALRLIEPSAP